METQEVSVTSAVNYNLAFKGMVAAVVTPLDAAGRFWPRQFEKLLERLYGNGVQGLYVCGQTGEGISLPLSQRKLVAEAAVANSPTGTATIIHVAAHSTSDAIELAKHASEIGATAISSAPPIGFSPYTFVEIKKYYEDLATATNLPLVLYHCPDASATVMSIDQVIELCQIPNVVGIKFTSFDLLMLSQIRRHTSIVFFGLDEALVAGFLMGADAGIGTLYNLIPGDFVRLYNLAKEGNWDQARQLQSHVNNLVRITLQFPFIPTVKLLLSWLGIDCGRCVPPARSLTPAEEDELRRLVTQWGLLV
jgi:N-acetylneuraminate lyase